MRVTYTIFKMNLLKLFLFSTIAYMYIHEIQKLNSHTYMKIIHVSPSFRKSFISSHNITISQYHSLSYGKIEKLPEVENKTQQCHSFNTKKTKLLSGLVHDFAFY